MIRTVFALLMLSGTLVVFAGCNTMEGMGEYFQNGGGEASKEYDDSADG